MKKFMVAVPTTQEQKEELIPKLNALGYTSFLVDYCKNVVTRRHHFSGSPEVTTLEDGCYSNKTITWPYYNLQLVLDLAAQDDEEFSVGNLYKLSDDKADLRQGSILRITGKDYPDCTYDIVLELDKDGSRKGFDEESPFAKLLVPLTSQEIINLHNTNMYELIKTYPGSPSLGTTTKEDMSQYEEFWRVTFKVGDWVTCVEKGEGEAGFQEGLTYQITSITNSIAFGGLNGCGVFFHNLRSATPEEIQPKGLPRIRGYVPETKYGSLTYGCQTFSLGDLALIRRLVGSEVQGNLFIGGKEITLEIVQKAIESCDR